MGPWVVSAVKSGASSLILSSDMSDVSPEKLVASMNFVRPQRRWLSSVLWHRRIDLLQLLLDQNETIASIHVIESVAGSLADNAKTTALVTLEQVGPSIDNSSFN